MSIIIAIANPKGGTAKTSTAVNLASALAITGRQILLCDLDAQGSATVSLDFPRTQECRIAEAMLADRPLKPREVLSYARGKFDLVPAGEELNALPALLYNQKGSLLRLSKALSRLAKEYDFIILDCPPGLGFMVECSLCAADYLIIPTHTEMMSLASAASLIAEASKLEQSGLTRVKILGMLITMHDEDDGSATFEDAKRLLKDCGPRVFTTVIPYSARVSEAQASGRPVLFYDKTSLGARAYLTFAGEVLNALAALKGASF